MPSSLPPAYDSKPVEARLYRFWEERGYFTAAIDPQKAPFVIIMPPPNVTGELHLGHALTAAVEDLMIRWHRMLGEPTLWLPGRDHAGIAAQVVVERALAEEGLSRHHLGREKFLERMWEWMANYGTIIDDQHRKLGASCDWSRVRFTMDPGPSRAVRTTFVNLHRKGLIYRGERIINWCPRCSTVLSDLEVEHQEVASHLYYVRYPLAEDEGQFVTVATTRPETILGDTAVAVNPKDGRHRSLVGKRVVLPAVSRAIPIIVDEAVDPAFGTGAVKITPSHDPLDFEVAQRHSLPGVNILNLDATMNENSGPYRGMDRYECRRAILADLERDGLLVKVEPYHHSVGHCIRCKTVVEPLVSQQWFVRIAPLAGPAIQAVTEGRIRIVPERFTKVYLNWMENIRDWCISRQLWWGHRIPVWYCEECGGETVAVEDPTACAHCGSAHLTQDQDVLDTWFSSALWPHSTLGWPEETTDLQYFYPTSAMETGYDILFFWVARMIMMGLENTGQVPFHTVYLHGLVRDEQGDKMSKSRGNVIDPLDAIDRYGTDALRFALATGSTPGNDMKLSPYRLEAGRNFANKIWNASRFILSSLPADYLPMAPSLATVEDRWILSRLDGVVEEANRLMADFQFGEAGRLVHDFFWGEFCDWYLEMAKIRLRRGDGSPASVLVHGLDICLRLLHPCMPFVTEETWQHLRPYLGHPAPAIILAPWPQLGGFRDAEAEEGVGQVIEMIRAIRNARAEYGVEPGRFISALVYGAGSNWNSVSKCEETIKTLARVEPLELRPASEPRPSQAMALVLKETEVYLPLAGMVDVEAEREKTRRHLEKLLGDLSRLSAKLSSQFSLRAPGEVVARERERLEAARSRLRRLQAWLELLGE